LSRRIQKKPPHAEEDVDKEPYYEAHLHASREDYVRRRLIVTSIVPKNGRLRISHKEEGHERKEETQENALKYSRARR